MMKHYRDNEPCPCSSGAPFQSCCKPLISGSDRAKTAEQLMRSRYSAFCIADASYLLATHVPSSEGASDSEKAELQAEIQEQEWLALRILKTEAGGEHDSKGLVEFAAYYRIEDGSVSQLHERSRFIRENGSWLYVDGKALPPVTPGRNDPCWCGSERKYKKCHLELG